MSISRTLARGNPNWTLLTKMVSAEAADIAVVHPWHPVVLALAAQVTLVSPG